MFSDIRHAISAVNSSQAMLIDVRSVEEFNHQSAQHAINIDLLDIQKGKIPKIDKNKNILLYCNSGNRSEVARSILASAGFTKVQNVGGLNNWLTAGGKMEIK